jgi:hypothetical protein
MDVLFCKKSETHKWLIINKKGLPNSKPLQEFYKE